MAAKPIKVSQLNGYIKRVLQMDPLLGNVSVQGEISNLKFHGSGHVYFTLKDEKSRINCFLPEDNLGHVHFQMTEGMQVIVHGYIYLYERGGSYSINVRSIEPDGIGSLAMAFEELKSRLSKKGYFDQELKKEIPAFPDKVAILTSDTGAAIEDMLRVIKLRNSHVDILIVPCLVQGPSAAADIADAIRCVNEQAPDVDVMIIGRGGGSMEELWAFNEEITAEAIHESAIPVISAVGHETDFTISDFVADMRAQTPTEAASIAVPDLGELEKHVSDLAFSMDKEMDIILGKLEYRLKNADVEILAESLLREIERKSYEASMLQSEMTLDIEKLMGEYDLRMNRAHDTLLHINPISMMERGYAAVTHEDGTFVKDTSDIEKDEKLSIHMTDGHVDARVTDIWRK